MMTGKYQNEIPDADLSAMDMLLWQFNREQGHWQEDFTLPEPKVLPKSVDGFHVTFINHCTFLIQVCGLNILTDPIWSERASPFSWAGPKRLRQPGLRFEDLPPIHTVLVSHDHYDHMDTTTLNRLNKSHQPKFFIPLDTAGTLRQESITDCTELNWWQSIELAPNIKLWLAPARHFSGRWAIDHNDTLWGSFVIETPVGKIYFAGDTGFGPHFAEIRKKFGPMRLAILPIGAYKPRNLMATYHLSPEEAVQAHQILQAQTSIASHFGTFAMADDGQEEPVMELEKALAKHNVQKLDFLALAHGQTLDLSK
ncbi:MAG: MBL fold metallo-hydrolase [Chlorobiales bacterium]|nr:MBL fold metallo-hydrolase [Chlorobiales bacterium]